MHIFKGRKEATVYPTGRKVCPQKVNLAKQVNAHLSVFHVLFRKYTMQNN